MRGWDLLVTKPCLTCEVLSIHCAVYSIQCAMYNVRYTVCSMQYVVYSVQKAMYILQYKVYTVGSIKYTLCRIKSKLCSRWISVQCAACSNYITVQYSVYITHQCTVWLSCMPCPPLYRNPSWESWSGSSHCPGAGRLGEGVWGRQSRILPNNGNECWIIPDYL